MKRAPLLLPLLFVLLLLMGSAQGCGPSPARGLAPETAANALQPQRTTQNLKEYGQMCAAAIGEIPPFDCLTGTVIPITKHGVEPSEYPAMMTCDFPPLLPLGEDGRSGEQGQCVPFTRVLDFSEGAKQVVVACRRKRIRDRDSPFFDEIDVIAHSTVDGSTCWFQATAKTPEGLDGTRVPSPTQAHPRSDYPIPDEFWNPPSAVANEEPKNCGYCHDNDPFMYSPYMAQVWNLVPRDPFGLYKHLGPDFVDWKPVSIATRDNTCLGCHRMGVTFTSGRGTCEATGRVEIPFANEWAREFPHSHWMPPGNFDSKLQWDAIYAKSAQDLLLCKSDPTRPGCIYESITGLQPRAHAGPVPRPDANPCQ